MSHRNGKTLAAADVLPEWRHHPLPPHAVIHDPADHWRFLPRSYVQNGSIPIVAVLPACVICHSQDRTEASWRADVGRKGKPTPVTLSRPVCGGCGAPWVARSER